MNKKITVLLVDDEADFTQPMSFWLQSKGYAVVVAPDGRKAVEIVKKDRPDIVFMDLSMPGGDGVNAVRDIRAFNKEIPIIIISAYLDDQRIREVGPHGISGVFYKGADFNEGLALLESALRTHKKLKDN
ncbi:MAG: response regulator [Candidatus Omnitrophota bacterium]